MPEFENIPSLYQKISEIKIFNVWQQFTYQNKDLIFYREKNFKIPEKKKWMCDGHVGYFPRIYSAVYISYRTIRSPPWWCMHKFQINQKSRISIHLRRHRNALISTAIQYSEFVFSAVHAERCIFPDGEISQLAGSFRMILLREIWN